MKNILTSITLLLLLSCGQTFARELKVTDPAVTLMKWTIDGAEREALVAVPRTKSTAPLALVFVLHGRNNYVDGTLNFFSLHPLWPEALVVYPQGLVLSTPTGKRKDGKSKSGTGWQVLAEQEGGADLKFFDAMLKTFRENHHIDEKHIHLAGHSNGGAFTYLLWQKRHDTIASVVVVAGGLYEARGHSNPASLLQPKPVMQIAGKKDDVFPFEAQIQMIEILKKVNRSNETSVPWVHDLCALFPSKSGATVVTFIHPGGHNVPKESLPLMIQFFREHPKP